MTDGSLEKMIYRRLLVGDGKGMSVPLDSRDELVTRHLFVLDSPVKATTAMRTLYWRSYFPMSVLAGGSGGDATSFPSLPANVILSNLMRLSNNWTYHDPFAPTPPAGRKPAPVGPADPTALKDGSVILRLHLIYAKGEAAGALGGPATVNLNKLFPGHTLSEVVEYSLTATQKLSDMKRMEWKEVGRGTLAGGPAKWTGELDPSSVSIGPMDIRTFVVQLTGTAFEQVIV